MSRLRADQLGLGRGMSDRDLYREVGEAARESIEKALAAKLTGRDLRVLLAIHHQLATYSRLEDSIYADKLAAITGLRVNHVRTSVARLIKAGAIRRRASKGRHPSLYGLPLMNPPRGRGVSPVSHELPRETDTPRGRDVSPSPTHPADGAPTHPADGETPEKIFPRRDQLASARRRRASEPEEFTSLLREMGLGALVDPARSEVLDVWRDDPGVIEEAWERWDARHQVGLAAGPGLFVEMVYDGLRDRRNGHPADDDGPEDDDPGAIPF